MAIGIVQSVKIRKKAHLRYELTAQGKKMQELLNTIGAFCVYATVIYPETT